MDNIIEGNKIIAEFMGEASKGTSQFSYWLKLPNKTVSTWVNITEVKYHTSWEWLMNVVEKIRQYEASDEGVGITVFEIRFSEKDKTRCCINYRTKFQGIGSKHKWIEHTQKSAIEAVWLAVVEFIKFKNKPL